MSVTLTVLNVAGYAALLLWGTHMVSSGVQRAFGARLGSFLGQALNNRAKAFAVGLGVTALLQSSTATGLMVAGFAASGLVKLVPALAVMLGANVGTTLIVQVLSFDVSAVAPALVLAGLILFRRDGASKAHDLGRVFIGLGIMLVALHLLVGLLSTYEHVPAFRAFIEALAPVPVVLALLGALVAWAAHSSVAVVLLVMTLAQNGIVPLPAACALVIGANLGAALNPLIEAPSQGSAAARRLPVGNLVNRLVGLLVGLAVLDPAARFLGDWAPSPDRAVADFHVLFNLAMAVVFMPFLSPLAYALQRLIPERIDPEDPSRPLYLDQAARETPVVALGGAAREALRLVDVLEAMLRGARAAVVGPDRQLIADIQRRDDVLDKLNLAIKTYLGGIDPDDLSEADRRRVAQILAFAMNLEQAGDVLDHALLPHLGKLERRGLTFSGESRDEICAMLDRLIANLRCAASLFMTDDPRAARVLAVEKVAFREAETRAMSQHIERLRSHGLDAVQSSALHLDLIRDMKLVNSHIVAAAAYPVLERTGELLQSRIAVIGG